MFDSLTFGKKQMSKNNFFDNSNKQTKTPKLLLTNFCDKKIK